MVTHVTTGAILVNGQPRWTKAYAGRSVKQVRAYMRRALRSYRIGGRAMGQKLECVVWSLALDRAKAEILTMNAFSPAKLQADQWD